MKGASSGMRMCAITMGTAPKCTVLGPPPACSRMMPTASSVRVTMALASGSSSSPAVVSSTWRP